MGSSPPPLGLLLRPPNPAFSLFLRPCSAPQNPSLPCSSLDSSSFRRGWVGTKRPRDAINTGRTWLCGFMRGNRINSNWGNQHRVEAILFGSDEEDGVQVPTQAQSVVEGTSTVAVSEYKPIPDIDYLQELLAIQQQGPRAIGFFGTRNMGFMHQQLIEILSYAMVITKNHIFTSGASGTNAAVIRGALRAEKPELLTVILPQSLKMQPPESQELLSKVKNLIEKPENDHLPLIEASRLCNMDILSKRKRKEKKMWMCSRRISGCSFARCHFVLHVLVLSRLLLMVAFTFPFSCDVLLGQSLKGISSIPSLLIDRGKNIFFVSSLWMSYLGLNFQKKSNCKNAE